MVVAGRESLEVVQSVDGDGIFGGVVADGSSVAGDIATSDVVCSLSTNEESVAAENSISGEGRSLHNKEENKPEASLTCPPERTLKTSRKARPWRPDCL